LGGQAKEEQVIQEIAKTLAHEAGHLISKFQGGEGPAEQKEREFEQRVGFELIPLIKKASNLEI